METQSLQFQLGKLLASFKGRRMTLRSTGFNPEPVISVWKQTRGREEEQFPLGLFLCIAFSTSIYRLGQSVVILCFQCNAVIILLIPGLVGKIHLFKCCGLWTVCTDMECFLWTAEHIHALSGSVRTQPLERHPV